MPRKLVILFGLEQTLIRHWNDPTPMFTAVLRDIIHNRIIISDLDVSFGIYSYALWCKDNIERFWNELAEPIQETLGINFDPEYVFDTMQMIKDFSRKNNSIEYNAYCRVIDKEKSIIDFRRGNSKLSGIDIIFIDDKVTNGMQVLYPDDGSIFFTNPLHLINIKRDKDKEESDET